MTEAVQDGSCPLTAGGEPGTQTQTPSPQTPYIGGMASLANRVALITGETNDGNVRARHHGYHVLHAPT